MSIMTDPKASDKIWDSLRVLSKQPSSIERILTHAEREFISSVVVQHRLVLDRIQDELIKIIEKLTGEEFRKRG